MFYSKGYEPSGISSTSLSCFIWHKQRSSTLTCQLKQTSSLTNTWQQPSPVKCAQCGQVNPLEFQVSVRLGKKEDLRDCEYGNTCLRTLDVQPSQLYRKMSDEEKISSCLDKNPLFLPEVRGEKLAFVELIGRQ